MKPLLLFLLPLLASPAASAPATAAPAEARAAKFGMHEIALTGKARPANPFDTIATVRFTPPSGQDRAVTVPAFFDGGDMWRARVYVSETGPWTWTSLCGSDPALDAQSGSFIAIDSTRRGRLLVHPKNPSQWITEDGRWFLNLNDTAYFLLSTHDGHGDAIPFEDFTAYVKDATDRGLTSFRSFLVSGPKPFHENNSGRHRWLEFFTDDTLAQLRLDGLQETDRRLRWLLEHHPDVAMQLILFPLERWRSDGGFWARMTAPQKERLLRHLLARYAAFPQIFWLIINDAHYAPVRSAPRPNEAEGTGTSVEFPNNIAFAREVGTYIHRHDPWQHPLSTGPARTVPFHFENEPWATYIHLEDNFDLGAAGMEKYRATGKPVFLGEDRYEQDRPERDPDDMRYFQRRLFWSWLLAGGSANYGGRWWVVHPYSQTGVRTAKGAHGGNPPPVFSRPLVGLDSVRVLRDYFSARRIELADFAPAPALVRDADGRKGPQAPKLMRRDREELLAYHPNADSADKGSRVSANRTARLRLDLARLPGRFHAEWFRALDGITHDGGMIEGGRSVELAAPWIGHDVVLRLLRSTPADR